MVDLCSDDLDNDGDGLVDCEEAEYVSSVEDCGLLSGPIAVGLGLEAPLLTFDVPMATIDGSTSGKSLMLVDVNGPAPGQDDLIVGRGLNVALFRNVATPNYLSLP